jgi:hypothetical protein
MIGEKQNFQHKQLQPQHNKHLQQPKFGFKKLGCVGAVTSEVLGFGHDVVVSGSGPFRGS